MTRKQAEKRLAEVNKKQGTVMVLHREPDKWAEGWRYVWTIRSGDDETVPRMIIGYTLKDVENWLNEQ